MANFGTPEHSLRASIPHGFTPECAEDIISNSINYSPKEDRCCVYVLLLKAEIVYVGQSVNLPMRLAQHAKTKDFDAYWSTPVPREQMSAAEAAYIVALNPRLNTTIPPNPDYVHHSAALSMIGGGWSLRNAIRAGLISAIPLHLGLVYRVADIESAINRGAA